MKWDHIIKNGTIVDTKESFKANIYIKDGKIVSVSSEELEGDAIEVTDAKGLYVLPGLMDTHVHSRDGGATHKEDFFHSTQAAAAGGLTTIFEMPNAIPAINSVENLNKQLENLLPKAHVDFAMWGLCLGDLNKDEIKKLDEAGVVAFKFFWGYAINSKTYGLVYNYTPGDTDVIPPLKDGEVYEIFKEVAKTGKLIAIHAENADMIQTFTKQVMESGDKSYEAFLNTRPNICEETITQTAISFSKHTGARLHLLHMSDGDSVESVKQAQEKDYSVTAETCPHFLFLSNEDFDNIGPMMKVYPPIRYKKDQEKLWEGIQDKVITMVCSDHAPHTTEEKTGDLWSIPAGMCGVETLAPLMIDAVSKGKISIHDLVGLLSENPAKLYGIYPEKGSLQVGTDADLTLVDFNKKYVLDKEKLHSKSKVTAYDGFELMGAPVGTIVRGITVMKDGEISSKPIGQFIKPTNSKEA